MAVSQSELGLISPPPQDIRLPQGPMDKRTLPDSADISEAIINPEILKPSGVVFGGPSVNGKPPGYLSPGDWDVLERYSRGYKEPPMGIHNPSECSQCTDNGNGSKSLDF